MNILEQIINHKAKEVAECKKRVPLSHLERKLKDLSPVRDFKEAVSSKGKRINLIAEIKKASPSHGIIREDFSPVDLACIYQENNASALSVVTDRKFFQGDILHLLSVRNVTSLPVLRKEFIIDEYQIIETRVFGADALLLIAAVLKGEQINRFLSISSDLGMQCLVEVHTREELYKVIQTNAGIIGINNRNLETFKTDIRTTLDLAGEIPKEKVIVSESGIKTCEDILLLQKIGINAIIIGQTLLEAKDIPIKMRELGF